MKTTTNYNRLYNDLLDLVISDPAKYLKDYKIVSLYNEETEYVICEKVEKDPEDEWWFILHTILPEQATERCHESCIKDFITVEKSLLENTLEDLKEDLDIFVPLPAYCKVPGQYMSKERLTKKYTVLDFKGFSDTPEMLFGKEDK